MCVYKFICFFSSDLNIVRDLGSCDYSFMVVDMCVSVCVCVCIVKDQM